MNQWNRLILTDISTSYNFEHYKTFEIMEFPSFSNRKFLGLKLYYLYAFCSRNCLINKVSEMSLKIFNYTVTMIFRFKCTKLVIVPSFSVNSELFNKISYECLKSYFESTLNFI